MKKYLLCPGHIISRNDGEVHYVAEEQLIRLYGVNSDECVSKKDAKKYKELTLLKLFPRPSGIYRVPKERL